MSKQKRKVITATSVKTRKVDKSCCFCAERNFHNAIFAPLIEALYISISTADFYNA